MKEPLGASASFEEEDMIERIATALYMSDSGAQGQWEMTNPTRWHRYARSAIEAMREPTEEMIRQGHLRDPLGCDVEDAKAVYPAIWEAMIDAAISSPEGGST